MVDNFVLFVLFYERAVSVKCWSCFFVFQWVAAFLGADRRSLALSERSEWRGAAGAVTGSGCLFWRVPEASDRAFDGFPFFYPSVDSC